MRRQLKWRFKTHDKTNNATEKCLCYAYNKYNKYKTGGKTTTICQKDQTEESGAHEPTRQCQYLVG